MQGKCGDKPPYMGFTPAKTRVYSFNLHTLWRAIRACEEAQEEKEQPHVPKRKKHKP